MKTNFLTSEVNLADSGCIGKHFESLFNIKQNSRSTADIMLNDIPYELKTRRFDAVSSLTLFGMESNWIDQHDLNFFLNHANEKLCNLILAYYKVEGSEYTYTSINRYTGFKPEIFFNWLILNKVERENHNRIVEFRIRNHNIKNLFYLYDKMEVINL
jgi:hypothetical protein